MLTAICMAYIVAPLIARRHNTAVRKHRMSVQGSSCQQGSERKSTEALRVAAAVSVVGAEAQAGAVQAGGKGGGPGARWGSDGISLLVDCGGVLLLLLLVVVVVVLVVLVVAELLSLVVVVMLMLIVALVTLMLIVALVAVLLLLPVVVAVLLVVVSAVPLLLACTRVQLCQPQSDDKRHSSI
jgi:hypothetical protein